MEKIAYLLEKGVPLQASRYKYLELLKQRFDVKLIRNTPKNIQWLLNNRPLITIIFGDLHRTFKTCLKYKIPYILVEQDVVTLRNMKKKHRAILIKNERAMIKNAVKIIFTSEDHRDYICKKYGYPKDRTAILPLRPLKKDIDFKPLPKLPGKTLVYTGGIRKWSERSTNAGYRSYYGYFKAFVRAEWKVYIYTARDAKVPPECLKIGCIDCGKVPQGELYRIMSQYTAGFQGYNMTGVPEKSAKYCMTCRPNKLWEYLAAGIPTIGFNGGNGTKVYAGQWGTVLHDLDRETLENIQLPKINEGLRKREVIDNDADRIKDFILS